jgi:hypothetical protein
MFVLSTGLVAIIAVMSGSLRYSFSNRDTIIATDLAQEGIELVRNVRDNDFAAGNNGFSAFSQANKHCRIDWNDPDTSLDCLPNQGSLSRYTLEYTGGMYQNTANPTGRFSRYIFIDYDTNGGEHALVRSFVVWGTGTLPPASGSSSTCAGSDVCVFTEAFLTNWK